MPLGVNADGPAADSLERMMQMRQPYDDAPPPYEEHEIRDRNASNTHSPFHAVYGHGGRLVEQNRPVDQYLKIVNSTHPRTNPRGLFHIERYEEALRMAEKGGSTAIHDYSWEASQVVEARWRAQGIWSSRWRRGQPGYRWAHEYPFKREPCSDSEDEREYQAKNGNQAVIGLFGYRTPDRPYRSPEARNESDKRRLARQAKRAHAHELSRPFQQFMTQIADECGRLIEAHEEHNGPDAPPPDDINTKAYEIVKARWKKNDIWRPYWSIVPGRQWQHELPSLNLAIEKMGADNVARIPQQYIQEPYERPFSPTPEPEPEPERRPKPKNIPKPPAEDGGGFGLFGLFRYNAANGNGVVNSEERGENSRSQNHNDENGGDGSDGNEGEGDQLGRQAQEPLPIADLETNSDEQRPVEVAANGDSEAAPTHDEILPDAEATERAGEAGAVQAQPGQDEDQNEDQNEDQDDVHMEDQGASGNAVSASQASASPRRSSRLQGGEHLPVDKSAKRRGKRPENAAARAKPSATQGISKKKSTSGRKKR